MEEWSMLDSDEEDFVLVTVDEAEGAPAGPPPTALTNHKAVTHTEPPSSPITPAPWPSSPSLILQSPCPLPKPSTTCLPKSSSSHSTLPTSVSQKAHKPRGESEEVRLKESDEANSTLSSSDAYDRDGDNDADSFVFGSDWSDCWSDGGAWLLLTDSEDEELDCRDRRKWTKFYGNKRRGHKFRHHHSR